VLPGGAVAVAEGRAAADDVDRAAMDDGAPVVARGRQPLRTRTIPVRHASRRRGRRYEFFSEPKSDAPGGATRKR
jgi:hypothetical protein